MRIRWQDERGERVRAAGGLDGRASPFLKASGEGCEWGFFKWSEDRMGTERRGFSLARVGGALRPHPGACAGGFRVREHVREAWFYVPAVSTYYVRCNHDRDLPPATRSRVNSIATCVRNESRHVDCGVRALRSVGPVRVEAPRGVNQHLNLRLPPPHTRLDA